MPKGLKRFYGRGELHFLTLSCYRRLPLLGTVRARNVFLHALGKITERYRFLLFRYKETLNSMHANPVKRGLVKNPAAWVWTSFLFYEKGEAGLAAVDPVV